MFSMVADQLEANGQKDVQEASVANSQGSLIMNINRRHPPIPEEIEERASENVPTEPRDKEVTLLEEFQKQTQ
jgi:hypothetical protein